MMFIVLPGFIFGAFLVVAGFTPSMNTRGKTNLALVVIGALLMAASVALIFLWGSMHTWVRWFA